MKVIQWREEGHAVVFIAQVHFATPTLSDAFREGDASSHSEFLELADECFHREKRFLLVLDAVNEFGGDFSKLLIELEDLVHQAKYPWFQMIYSVRDDAFHRVSEMYPGHRGVEPYYKSGQISASEFGPLFGLGPLVLMM